MKNYTKIRSRLNYYFRNKLLKVLDTAGRKYYTGVTLPYIIKYVLKEEFNREEVKAILYKMLLQKKLLTLYCGNVETVVFESGKDKTNHWKFEFNEDNTPKYNQHYNSGYTTDTESIEINRIFNILIKSYSNKFKS